MRTLWPTAQDDVDAAALYRDDARPEPPGRPWVVVNMVASADGSALGADGLSGGLSGPADKAVFFELRALADVVMAGASTVVAEDYGPARPSEDDVRRRLARGQAPRPRIAVVTASLLIDPGRRLFTESPADARPVVLTMEQADAARRRRLEAVADVHTAGTEQVDWRRALAVLREVAGAHVVLCEGGPTVVGQLVAEDLIDELCLTVSPLLVGGPGPRIARSLVSATTRALTLDRVLEDDGALMLRYVRSPASA